jgi:hypothetical protein
MKQAILYIRHRMSCDETTALTEKSVGISGKLGSVAAYGRMHKVTRTPRSHGSFTHKIGSKGTPGRKKRVSALHF